MLMKRKKILFWTFKAPNINRTGEISNIKSYVQRRFRLQNLLLS